MLWSYISVTYYHSQARQSPTVHPSPYPVVAREGDGYIARVKGRPDVELWEVTRSNRDELPVRVLAWLVSDWSYPHECAADFIDAIARSAPPFHAIAPFLVGVPVRVGVISLKSSCDT